MAQTKKKQSTKTAKKVTASRAHSTTKKTSCKSAACRGKVAKNEKIHVYAVTVMSMVAGILLCASAAMMMAA